MNTSKSLFNWLSPSGNIASARKSRERDAPGEIG
jgi:hypothetical protein